MTEQELAGMIWNIKEIIRGVCDDTEVEKVILPFSLLFSEVVTGKRKVI